MTATYTSGELDRIAARIALEADGRLERWSIRVGVHSSHLVVYVYIGHKTITQEMRL